MTLREKQVLFARLVPRLIDKAFELGYEVTLGEVLRAPEQAAWNAAHGKGISNSLHLVKLAIDLNLFRNGIYLEKSEDYKTLGEFWKSLHPDCCFGGDFKPRADGNHFSMAYGGRK